MGNTARQVTVFLNNNQKCANKTSRKTKQNKKKGKIMIIDSQDTY